MVVHYHLVKYCRFMPTPDGLLADINASRGAPKSPGKLRSQIAAAGTSKDIASDGSGLMDGKGIAVTFNPFAADERDWQRPQLRVASPRPQPVDSLLTPHWAGPAAGRAVHPHRRQAVERRARR